MIIKQIDERKRITLPREILEKLKLKEGDYIILKEDNGKILLLKANISEETKQD